MMFHSKLRPAVTAAALAAILLCGVQEVTAGARTHRDRESRNRQSIPKVEAPNSWMWLFGLLQKIGSRVDPWGTRIGLEGQTGEDPEAVGGR